MAAVLNSWKEIASFLDRGVRTAQRWERDQNLPVHRVGTGPRAPVYAFEGELQVWLCRSVGEPSEESAPQAPFPPSKWLSTRSEHLQRHRELFNCTRQLLQAQRVRLAALLNTLSTTERRFRSSAKPATRVNGEVIQPAATHKLSELSSAAA